MSDQRKVAFITGAGSGIGRGTAKLFAARGYAAALVDMNEAGGRETEAAIREAGGDATFIACNVADNDSVKSAVDQTVAAYGRLDAAFNAAGVDGAEGKFAADYSIEGWNRVLAENLTGVWYCMRNQIPAILASGGGAIVNCASTAGIRGAPYFAAYCASKHGVVGLTKAAALEYAGQGVRINAVCPGTIATPMTQGDPQRAALINQMASESPIGRIGQPEEIGGAVFWLCNDDSSFVHGQALAVDGALTSR
jgi:NAD(P)-dependent dehydrogenase (short-subunit alcohol dehydrogenase family)